MQPLLLLLAYASLELALYRSYGRLDPVALALVVLALGFSLGGIRGRWPAGLEPSARRLSVLLLYVLLSVELVQLFLTPVETLFELDVPLTPFRIAAGVAAAVLLSYVLYLWPRARFFALVAVFAAMAGSLILASPEPNIDVWHFRQRACHLLLRGENPYTADYPNLYADQRQVFGDFHPYGPEELKDGRVQSYPYPPLSLILDLPGYLVGDVRWSLLAALAAAALLTRAMGRRLGLPPGHVAELAIVLLLLCPAGFSVIERSWIDPYLVLGTAACGWALAANRTRLVWIASAGALAAKQYGLLWLPGLWATGRCRVRDLAGIGVVASLTVLPFLVWDAEAMWKGLVTFHWQRPPQKQALSLPSALAAETGQSLPGLVAPLAAAAIGAAIALLAPRRMTTLFAGGAVVFLGFFLLSKWAFLNYYWFAMALLVQAVVAASAEVEQAQEPAALKAAT